MWKIFSISVLLFLLGCSEDSGTGPGNGLNLSIGSMRVDISGTRWDATDGLVNVYLEEDEGIAALGLSAIKSISSSEIESFSISLSKTGNIASLEDSYSLLLNNGEAYLGYIMGSSQNSTTYVAVDGQLVISDITSTNVKGSFNAICVNSQTLQDTIAMTNGSFNAKIINQSPLP